MPILQSVSNFFAWFKKEPPKVKWVTVGFGLSINYDTTFDVFYKTYKYNPFIRAAIGRRKKDAYRFGVEIKKWETVQDINLFADLLKESVWYTPKKFLERIIRDYEVTGNAYVYVWRDKTNWSIIWIQALDPRYVKPISNDRWQVLWYVQNLAGTRFLLKDEVFHLKDDPDLENETIWASKMESLFIDLETDREAKESNLAFFKNNQTPASLILIDPEYELEDEAWLEVKLKEIFESGKFQGGSNRHRSAFIQWVKEIVKVQDKINDAEFLEQRKFSLALVCSVYGVNADLLGITENSNRSTGDVQTELYYDSIEEEEDMFDEFFTKILQAVYADWSLTFNAVKDSLRTLQKKASIATEIYQGGLVSLDEGREIIGYQPAEASAVFYQAPQPTAPDPKDVTDTKKKVKK